MELTIEDENIKDETILAYIHHKNGKLCVSWREEAVRLMAGNPSNIESVKDIFKKQIERDIDVAVVTYLQLHPEVVH